MYYDTEKTTYLVVPEAQPASQPQTTKKTKNTNMSAAKKVMKDMERWEKMVNQKKDKENASSLNCTGSRSADSGYSSVPENQVLHQHELHAPSLSNLLLNNSVSNEETVDFDQSVLLDLTKLICNLCQRQLHSKESLQNHVKFSELHKNKLEKLKTGKKTDTVVYRDRAKERRMKHRDTSDYVPRMQEIEQNLPSTSYHPIGVENIGNRMLQKMGWSDGQGLGKTNQGSTSLVEVLL